MVHKESKKGGVLGLAGPEVTRVPLISLNLLRILFDAIILTTKIFSAKGS